MNDESRRGMMNTQLHDIHCGACGEKFDTGEALSRHLDACPAVLHLTPLSNRINIAGDLGGHPLAHLLNAATMNGRLIRRYCYAVADDMQVMKRARLHIDLCAALGLAYETFRPFEDPGITAIPTRKEALEIFYRALRGKADEIIAQDPQPGQRSLSTRFFQPGQA